MGGRAGISPDEALIRYLAMGSQRSLDRLASVLRTEGISVHPMTLRRWSSHRGWVAHAADYDSRIRESRESSAVSRAAIIDGDHATLGRELQRLALQWAEKLALEEAPMTPMEVARWAEAGVRIERLAFAASMGRKETLATAFVMPVLRLYRDVVQPALRDDVREEVDRAFADGINAITGFSDAEPDQG
ncbi:MAG: hypothetical protein IT299_02445 [Dehalococcoidia bacterium]|nr:hypothetical protein [Dehalococcoidia bacterium]